MLLRAINKINYQILSIIRDLQLIIFNLFFFSETFIDDFSFYFFNSINPILQNGLTVFNWNYFYQFPQNMSFFFSLKFCLSIAFLILIRGGAPRYRYDYLTKLGWLKFLSFIILMFLLILFLFFLF